MPGSDLAEPAVRCQSLTVEYRTADSQVRALRGIEADFRSGQVAVIASPSGSGKSSLLRCIGGLQRPTSGSIDVAGVEITRLRRGALRRFRRRTIGYVLQRPSDNLVPYLKAEEQIVLAARLRGVGADDGDELLARLGLADRSGTALAHLSGGEQQRLAFAAAVIGRPAVVLADEPTAELDDHSAEAVITALFELARTGAAVVVASHDPALVSVATHVVRLDAGVVSEVR